MGGVELLDRFISQYHRTIHGKNGTGLFFELSSNVITCILENSLRSSQKKQSDLLNFSRSVVMGILNKPKPCSSAPSGIRNLTNSGSHYPVPAEKHGSCPFCKHNSRRKCLGCNVLLHPLCFYKYHKQF